MWPAFPASDYYEGSVPASSRRLTVCLPAAGLADRQGGRLDDGSHVHHMTVRRDRCPALPLQPRHGYAADLHRGLRAGQPWTDTKLPVAVTDDRHALLTGPDPPGSSRRST